MKRHEDPRPGAQLNDGAKIRQHKLTSWDGKLSPLPGRIWIRTTLQSVQHCPLTAVATAHLCEHAWRGRHRQRSAALAASIYDAQNGRKVYEKINHGMFLSNYRASMLQLRLPQGGHSKSQVNNHTRVIFGSKVLRCCFAKSETQAVHQIQDCYLNWQDK